MNSEQQNAGFWDRNRILIKGFLIGFLILLMLIPSTFIMSLVNERELRQEEVVAEISNKWAKAQTILGPVLLVPYKGITTDKDGKTKETRGMAYFLPDTLNVKGDMKPEVRHRSLFSVTLYRSALAVTGSFNPLPLGTLQIPPEDMLWGDARIAMHIDDVRGLEDEVLLNWNGTKQLMGAGVPDNELMETGLSVPVTIGDKQGPIPFSFNLNLRGSEYLYFTPVGKITKVELQSPWKDPAFGGQYLPTQTPGIANNGFVAKWEILPLAHTTPQCWKDGGKDLKGSAFGVRLIQPVDGYSKTNRSVKYAILFIALTFIFFFFLEILQKRQIHPLQYILVGFALTIFYTLLLSISEYTGFNAAYLIAAVATISLISMYVWSIFKSRKTTAGFTITLTALYSYIFVLIQSEDYALLSGSIGLFFIIAIIMYYSRKIDWYATTKIKRVASVTEVYTQQQGEWSNEKTEE